ncbi:MAG: gamma-glutamylcyclotransferase [Rickettsiales bacterium]|nr:gamma-glutamylcyclotransferase [Rickettsiales bacterium]|tara:strand:- start:920 stop:1297 length:378 start_codon:yes stop_codon:yes gene_type:complete
MEREESSQIDPSRKTLLFVYGTLLRGQRNHHFLGGSEFIAAVRTAPVYRLVSLGSFPALREAGNHSIPGELYAVSNTVLLRCDALEGHPHFYLRRHIELADGRRPVSYVLPPDRHPQARTIKHWP